MFYLSYQLVHNNWRIQKKKNIVILTKFNFEQMKMKKVFLLCCENLIRFKTGFLMRILWKRFDKQLKMCDLTRTQIFSGKLIYHL